MNALDALRQHTVVVADTGDFARMASFAPQDATTNPSLILKALDQPAGQSVFGAVMAATVGQSAEHRLLALLVGFGLEILKIIPGRVSTEVDARLSFDAEATVAQAMTLMEAYAKAGVGSDRVLIKVAATWEGIRAAERLERAGVHCNLTLLFSRTQAQASAEAGATLISPFVGRITDWHKAKGETWAHISQDPGVRSVREIYADFKRQAVATEIMGASFRTPEQVLALAGCDLLTVSPEILALLQDMPVPEDFAPISRLKPIETLAQEPVSSGSDRLTEAQFRYRLNASAMASEKLAEGIRLFARDGEGLLTRLTTPIESAVPPAVSH